MWASEGYTDVLVSTCLVCVQVCGSVSFCEMATGHMIVWPCTLPCEWGSGSREEPWNGGRLLCSGLSYLSLETEVQHGLPGAVADPAPTHPFLSALVGQQTPGGLRAFVCEVSSSPVYL